VRVIIVAVGGVKGALSSVVSDYEARASRYWKLTVEEVTAGTKGGSKDASTVMAAEAERLLGRVPAELELIALTRDAKQMGSAELSRYLESHAIRSSAGLAFVIGGAHGLDASVLARAARRLSFSKMTLPHEVARVLLAEQLYRAGTILRGEPYQKG